MDLLQHRGPERAARGILDPETAVTEAMGFFRHRLWVLLNFEIGLGTLDDASLWRRGRAEPREGITLTEVTRRCYA